MKNSLLNKFPDIARQWHPTKNKGLRHKNGELATPENTSYGNMIEVYWKCPAASDHVWKSPPNYRTGGKQAGGCPFCRGLRATRSNCLATTHPRHAKHWHPTANSGLKNQWGEDLTPKTVTARSGRRVQWKCPKGPDHEWGAIISNVTGSSKIGCAVCHGKKIVKSTCLATTHPELAAQWHPTKNKNLKNRRGDRLTPQNVSFGSRDRVYWKCPKGPDHEWSAKVRDRGVKGDGCSICRGLTVVKSNCLATTHPELKKRWHYRLNREQPLNKGEVLTPQTVTATSKKRAWWKCEKRHFWPADIGNMDMVTRAGRTGCPFCSEPGFNPGKPGTIYIYRVRGKYLKIGITNRSTADARIREARGADFRYIIELERRFSDGLQAWVIEQYLLGVFGKRYAEELGEKFDGSTETVPTGSWRLIKKELLKEFGIRV